MEIFTYIFLGCSFIVLVPVAMVGWDMYRSRGIDGSDTAQLATTILYITISNLIFHAAQFTTVFLGALGLSMEARIPIIILVDGSLVLLTATYIYAFFKIREIRSRQITSE